jgi:uncharacterized YigZ family protein
LKGREIISELDSYLTVEKEFRHQIKKKGSTFIGTLAHTGQKKDAEKFIENIRKEFHDATHNCYAYRIDSNELRYSDDGEPSGTAGKPILSIIDKYKLQEVALTVTRYFGGTKLGTGGLARAYSECAEHLIRRATIIRKIIYQNLIIVYDYEQINKVQHMVHKYGAHISDDATTEGMKAQISIPASKKQQFLEEVINITSGKIKILSNN